MRHLLSIRTVYPKPGARVWYDDQRQVHRQIYEGDEAVDYAFMGQNADAAENRWLRDAMDHGVPIIFFLGIAPGIYRALILSLVIGWGSTGLKASIAFSAEEEDLVRPPKTAAERRYALRHVKQRLHRAPALTLRARFEGLRVAAIGVDGEALHARGAAPVVDMVCTLHHLPTSFWPLP